MQAGVKGADGRFHARMQPIVTVGKGEPVFACDPKAGKTQLRRVLRTTVREVDRVLTIALADAKTHGLVERITHGLVFIPCSDNAAGE